MSTSKNKPKTEKRRLFHWALLPAIIALAWPTMLEQLLQTVVQYVDTAMVGSLGTDAVAAVGSTTTVNWLIGSTVSAVGVGFLAFISQALGEGDEPRARRAASQAVLAALTVGSVFTVLSLAISPVIPALMQVEEHVRPLASRYFFILYLPMLPRAATTIFGTVLRAAGDTKTPMRVGLLVNGVNVTLNFLLIYPTRQVGVLWIPGAGLGVTGAAIASAIAFAVGGILITLAVLRHPRISPRGYSMKPDRTILLPCLRVAFPNVLQRFGTSLGYVAFAAMVNSLGEISTAAHTIANTVESAFYVPGYGMQAAAATLTGNAVGAGDSRRIRELGSMLIAVEVTLMVLSGGALFLFAPNLVSMFSKDAEVIALGSAVLRMVALSEPFYGVSIVIEGMLQGMGRTFMPFVTGVACMWGIRIVGTALCLSLLPYGLISAWACMIAHNMMLFVVFSIYYTRLRRNPLVGLSGTVRQDKNRKKGTDL